MRYEAINDRDLNLLPCAEAASEVSAAYIKAGNYSDLAGEIETPMAEAIRQGLEYTYRQAGHALTLVLIAHLGLARESDTADKSIEALTPYVTNFLDAHTEWVDNGTPVGYSEHVEDIAYELVTAFMAILDHPEVVPECVEPDCE